MSNFPSSIDNDSTIPSVYDNITEIGGEAINALKEAVINIEEELGVSCSGSVQDLSTRLNVSLNPDGTIKASALTGLGLVTLPINNSDVATNASILESKLLLDHSTQDLFNSITNLGIDVDTALSWINNNGNKISLHINGTSYNHYSSQILISSSSSNYLNNKFNSNRNNSNLYNLLFDLNNELVEHQQYDGSGSSSQNVTTNNGLKYPDNFAHHASGLYIDSSRFVSIPETIQDLQALAEFVDTSSLLLFGTRVQNFFSNGVSKQARSSTLPNDGYGQILISSTQATTYLRTNGTATSPVDNIDSGDDIIELKPTGTILSTHLFDAQFSQVKVGDIIDVNYGSVEASFIIKERKYVQSGSNKKFIVRINGVNLKYTTTASVVISKAQYHVNKQHVLALAQAHNEFANKPSLISVHPRSASVLGIGFNPNLIDEEHYNLYLQIYPNGNLDNVVTLPAIDITGNLGKTPGKYTLDSIVLEANNSFRISSKNYRFVAFQYNGEFGIAMSDPYNNTCFSVISAVVNSSGSYDETTTKSTYPNNVIDVFSYTDSLSNPQFPKDALGLGIYAANLASPPYKSTYDAAVQAITSTKIFVPLKKNFYYVNGSERDQFSLDVDQTVDQYGDGYWLAEVTNQSITPGPGGKVETTYKVNLDLKSSSLMIGKTLVIQPIEDGYFVDSGRFIISNVNCVVCSPTVTYTEITVYDAVHGQESSPQTTLSIGSNVRLYFSFDSIGFNEESSTDISSISPFKRFFEVYVDSNGKTFSHERARFVLGGTNLTVNGQTLYASSNNEKFNIISVSKKLKGYSYGNINKISLYISSYDSTSGLFSGYLNNYNGTNNLNRGPITYGYAGEITRFYDNSNVDYIDLKLSIDSGLSSYFGNNIDIQLFPSLEDDQEVYLLGNCTLNQQSNKIENLIDKREFGNVSEQNLTNSAIDFISVGEKYLHTNGVVSGFDLETYQYNVANNQISLTGGIAIVNGKFVILNPDIVEIPLLLERYSSVDYNILWALCLNDKNEYVTYPLLDVKGVGNYYSSNRIFTVFNPINSTTYKLESLTKSKLLNRKDLCLLYLVNSVVADGEATLTVSDARKFSYSSDSLVAKVSPDKEFGNFKSVDALLNWLKLSNTNISYASLKNVNEFFNSSIEIESSSMIELDGENNCTLTFSPLTASAVLRLRLTNVVLKNMNITMSGTTVDRIILSNSKLINCTISSTFNGGTLATGAGILLGENSELIDCTITNSFVDSSTGINNHGIVINGENVKIQNCTFSATASQTIDSVPNFIHCDGYDNIVIYKNSVTTDCKRFAYFKNCSNVKILENNIITNFDPGTYDSNYSLNDVSSVGGCLELELSSSVSNIDFSGNTFTNPDLSYRLAFIGVLINANDVVLDKFNISNNQFYQFEGTDQEEDFQGAIFVVNKFATTNSSSNYVYLKNGKINNNYCNNNQQIIIAPKIHSDSKMYLRLIPINVEVKNNNCGNIGYYVTSGRKTTSTVTYPLVYKSQDSRHTGLVISENNCHIIRLADSAGRTVYVASDSSDAIGNVSQNPTGDVIIENNTANFIHVGCAYQANSSLKIVNNNLPGYDNSYLTCDSFSNAAFLNTLAGTLDFSLFVGGLTPNYSPSGDPANGFDSNVIIENNNIYKGYWVNFLNNPTNFNPNAYIRCDSSANIKNNFCRDTDSSAYLVVIGSGNCLIEGNKIYRGSQSITNYMIWENLIDGSSRTDTNPKTTLGIVVNNIFDSSTVDGADDNLLKDSFPIKWIVHQNLNQVEYASFSVISDSLQYDSGTTTKNASRDSTVTINSLQTAQDDVESIVTRITTADTNAKFYSSQWNLNNHLPTNVKIVGLNANVRKSSGTLSAGSSFNLKINKFTTTFSAPTNNLDVSSSAISTTTTDDPYFGDFEGSSVSGTDFNAAVVGANINIIPNVTNIASENYVINHASPVVLTFFARFTVSSGTLDMLISPILVKYKW